ncbi:MAG: FAD-dependent oxidoreductase [Chloroflexi bacterium]|nr:FAD-dependent oxidoreductase [Chloroflexota bacterium]
MSQSKSIKWPYLIQYEEEEENVSDVLVLGGGIAGCWAAITAARLGASVTLVDKGCTIRSGCGGPGCDHWAHAADNPASKLSPEEQTKFLIEGRSYWTNGITAYINAATGYETLLELEQIGGKVRDTDDQFEGADFRDEKTKLMYAYDYETRDCIRVWGPTFKPALYAELKALGVKLYERCQATSLLTEKGKQAARVIGATALNIQTGKFVVLKAKAVIMAMAIPSRNWVFSTEHRAISTFKPIVNSGNGHAMAWRAGAELTMMERSLALSFDTYSAYIPYGDGNCYNTWYPCNMVDADGKEIPWVNRDGKILTDFRDRTHPSRLGQKMFTMVPGMGASAAYQTFMPQLIFDLKERIIKGEYKLPLYADLTSLPEMERNVIWGMMIGSESKTKIPIWKTYTEAGFDPKQDLLQSYYMLGGSSMMREPSNPKERMIFSGGGGLVVDWDLMTTLPGLFAAGEQAFSTNGHAAAATTGRYAAKRAVEYSAKVSDGTVNRRQVDKEKQRVLAPAGREDGVDWKEFNMGLCRIMQNYCSEPKTEHLMDMGLDCLKEYENEEMPNLYASNPHILGRVVDVMDILTVDQIIVHASKARKASSSYLNFNRMDYTSVDPQNWRKWITLKDISGDVQTGELALDYFGSISDMKKNYDLHDKKQ